MSELPRHKWALEVRLNEDKTLDEIVCDDAYVHLEQMDDNHWWMVVSDGKKKVHVNLMAKGKIAASFFEDEP